MLFWVIAAVLTLVASLAVLLPLAAKPKSQTDGSRHDLEVYRDQLAELDRDLARGLIQPIEAEQARAEVARRIIHLGVGGASEDQGQPSVSASIRLISAAAVLAVPLISWGTYAKLGSPDIPSQPLTERMTKTLTDSSVDELVARAEAHLSANPTDGQGWEVLAPVYMRMQRFDDAANAYRNAIKLVGASSERQSGLGEALVNAGGGEISPAAKLAFDEALKLDPSNANASFFVAMWLAQEGRKDEAVAAWQQMRAGLPQGSPWLGVVDKALASAQVTEAPAAKGPSKEEMSAAAEMSPEDRASMIAGMVARLDERLRQNPKDAEGWRQLIRSYLVIGDANKAQDALKRAVSVFGTDSEQAKELVAFASSNGLEVAE